MGEVTIEGKLRPGYAALSVHILCRECSEPPATRDNDAAEKLMGMFGMGGPWGKK